VSRASAFILAAGFAVLAVLVAGGGLTSVDRWAVDNAMPGADFAGKPTFAGAVIPLWDVHWHGVLHVVSELATLPASFTPATLLVAAACLAVRGRAAVVFAAAFAAGTAIEVLVKGTLTRPALYAHGMHLSGFDASYPSGHTTRTVLVALAVAWAWPRLELVAGAWAGSSIVLIELSGQHVPSDIAGGLLLAGALLATTWSLGSGARWKGRHPSPACRPSSPAP
jgi:membrane-associated phospholipid phosphatase